MDKFNASWTDQEMVAVADDWKNIIKDYIIKGYDPGSFFCAMLSNNLMRAAATSHKLNSWDQIRGVVKWLYNRAPTESYGSAEKVKAWLGLTPAQRRKACEDAHLLATAWEILQEPA